MPKRKSAQINSRRYERSAHSYDRRPGKRSPGRCILIVCEGAETEPNYFEDLKNYLKLSTIQVKIKDRAGAPITVVSEARALVEKRNKDSQGNRVNAHAYEAVWCVFDVENPNENPTFNRAIELARQNQYQLAVSNPSFEYWYLLHFDPVTTRPFANGKEAKAHLIHFIPEYHESMPVFNLLKDLTWKAVQRARDILLNHPQGGSHFPNPSTQVFLLVEEMINMSPSGREHLCK